MKNYLLTLAAAAVMATSVQAQVPGALMNPITKNRPSAETVAKNLMLDKRVTTSVMPAVKQADAKKVLQSLNLRTVATRAEAGRDTKELSYQTYGTEYSQEITLAPTGVKTTDLSNYGCSGVGFAQVYRNDILASLAGNKISSIEFSCWMGTYTNLTAFVLDGSTGNVLWQSEPIDVQTSSQAGVLANKVACDYTITGEESSLIIGWVSDGFTAATDDPYYSERGIMMIAYPDNSDAGYAAYMMTTDQSGITIFDSMSGPYTDGENLFTLASHICVKTTGEKSLPNNDASSWYVDQIRKAVGEPGYTKATIQNMGLNRLSSFDYEFELNGAKKTGTCTFETPLNYYEVGDIDIEALMAPDARMAAGTFTITGVNGAADENTANYDNEVNYVQVTMDSKYNRTPVIEEYTSTQCPNCPIGIPALKEAAELCPQAVIIAVHADYQGGADPLKCTSYADALNTYVNSFPTAIVNREASYYPYKEVLDGVVSARQTPAEASITLSAEAPLGMSKKVSMEADVTFTTNAPKDAYSLVYALVEDGVTGVYQFSKYAHLYNISGGSQNSDATYQSYYGWDDVQMALAKEPATEIDGYYYTQPTFDHTAVAINDAMGTATSSALPEIVSGQTYNHTGSVTIPTRTPAVDLDNVKAIALLIDNTTGAIVTAAETKLDETSAPSAIEGVDAGDKAQIAITDGAFAVTAEHATAEVYTVDGKLVSSCTVNGQASLPTFGKGVYVIRVVEGQKVTTKKATF